MSEPMSEERRLAILGSITAIYLAAPESVAEDISANLRDCLSEIGRQSAELKHKNEQISLLKNQLQQQSDYIARLESQRKGGFW